MMNSKNSDFVPLMKHVKLEHNTHDYYNNNGYCIEDKQRKNLVSRDEIKCKSKCFDIVDKWIARVVVKVPTGNNWHSIVAREVALLKVRYPFLTEQQLRGKALMKFGIPSLCGNVVRTGAGKVTGAIAKELSRKKDKTRRIPAAFKVLKNFLPCINKFEAKRETDMWVQENQRIPTLYNRETTNCTEKIIQTKTIVKPEIMEKKYWRPLKMQPFVMNPMNKQVPFYSPPNTRIINNAFEQISCSASTPKKEQPLIPRRKALLSKFNDTDMTIFNESNIIEQERRKIKQELTSPDSKQCLRIIANDFKENLWYNDGDNETCEKKRPKKKMQTYSQLSQESKDILAHFQRGSQSQKAFENIENSNQTCAEVHMKASNKNFEEIDLDVTEFEPGNSNYSYRRQLFSESSAKGCKNENSIFSYQHKTSFQSVSVLDDFPSHSQPCSSSRKMKYSYSNSMNSPSPPQKKLKHNNDHHFQGKLSDNASYVQLPQLFNTQTISIKSFDESAQSEIHYTQNSKCCSVNTFFEPTPFSGKLSLVGENRNYSGISMPRQYSAPCDFKSLSLPNTQFSRLSTLRRDDSSLGYLWEDMNSQNLSCKNLTESQGSRTTCTLTPDITGMSSGINAPHSSYLKDVPRQISPDLLDRENILQFSFSKSNSTLKVHDRLDHINCNTQSNIQSQVRKSFMLSDFCSEYDDGWQRLIRETPKFINNKKMLMEQSITISISTIKIGIEIARKILDEDIGDTDE